MSVSQICKGEKLAVLRETIVYLNSKAARASSSRGQRENPRTQMESW